MKLQDLSNDLTAHLLSFLPFSDAYTIMQVSKLYLAAIHALSHEKKSSENGVVRAPHLVRPRSGRLLTVLPSMDTPLILTGVLPDGRLVCASEDGTLRVWIPDAAGDYSSERCVELSGHTSWVWQVIALPNGRLVSGSTDGTLRIWIPDAAGDYSSERCVVLEGHTGAVLHMIALSNGRLVSASEDGTLRVWAPDVDGNYSSERCVVLNGHIDCVNQVIALSNGCLVSASEDGTLRVWTPDATGDYSSERCVVLEGHASRIVESIALPNGRLVSASGEDDEQEGTLRVWIPDAAGNYSSERCVVLEGHAGDVNRLLAISDGRLVSASVDRTLRIWIPDAAGNYSSERCVVLRGHTGDVNRLMAFLDGRLMSASDEDATLRVWTPNDRGAYHRHAERIDVLSDLLGIDERVFFSTEDGIHKVSGKRLSNPLLSSTTPLRALRQSEENKSDDAASSLVEAEPDSHRQACFHFGS